MSQQYNLQLTQFQTTDNLTIPGLLYEPKNNTNKAALYLHGNGSSSIIYSTEKMNYLGENLTQKNIAFFPFNNRGANLIKPLEKIKGDVKEKVKTGMTYELIRECIYDIDGAVNYLTTLDYKIFYLIGSSTGANKIVVYSFHKPVNKISKYILVSGGDDTGLYYREMGKNKYNLTLKKSQKIIEKGYGEKLAPEYLVDDSLISYQSLYDTINPDGDYNIFPFNEYLNNLKLSKKELFREYKKINKPTLVIYGELDEYCYGNAPKCVEILKKECSNPKLFTFKIIPGADHRLTNKEEELAKIVSNYL